MILSSSIPKSLGFPRMHKEKNEKRDFTPFFFKGLYDIEQDIFLEKSYGENMGFTEKDYLSVNPKLKFVSHEEAYSQDAVIVLRAPSNEELKLLKSGSILISMLHFSTRETRNKLMEKLNIIPISLDSITNDLKQRLVVDYQATAWNGIEIGFKVLRDILPPNQKRTLKALILGTGAVGKEAIAAVVAFGGRENRSLFPDILGTVGMTVNEDIANHRDFLANLMNETDILVDATFRPDASKIVIPNEMLTLLSPQAVIVDLSVDPYDTDISPMQVKAIEGIPTGTLDHYIFLPEDPEYTSNIPKSIKTKNKLAVISCNAWPGIYPKQNMEKYGIQLLPFIKVLVSKPLSEISLSSDNFFDRALYRGTYDHYIKYIKPLMRKK